MDRASGGSSSSRRCSSSSSGSGSGSRSLRVCWTTLPRRRRMQPPAEHVHWMFATGFLLLGLCLLGETVVGEEVWRRRAWRRYLWPALAFGGGVFMWAVMVFFTNSAIHMLAHGVWAQVMMLAGAAELGLASGKLQSA